MDFGNGPDPADWKNIRLLVVGDLMLDEYLWGGVERISPEAPVPVVKVDRETAVLGGAGNVVRNLLGLGGRVMIAGVIGPDPAGERIAGLMVEAGADASGLVRVKGRRTSRKSRVMAGHQQVARIDRESTERISARTARRIMAQIEPVLDSLDGLILSDYAKGTLTPNLCRNLIDLFRTEGKPVIVDPKGKAFGKYKGATLLTPNRSEAEAALGLDFTRPERVGPKALRLLAKQAWQGLLVTRGGEGMSLFQDNEEEFHIPARARQVFDVSGAGDTVASVMGLGLAAGWGLAETAVLANLAGGVVVGKLGTAPLTLEELQRASDPADSSKIVGHDRLLEAVREFKAAGRQVVLTNGCFDLLHPGQIHFLNESKARGGALIVALDDDESVRRVKGRGRPVIGQEERARMVAALDSVDLVTIFRTEELIELLTELVPDVLTKGGNYEPEEVVGGHLVEEQGGTVCLIPLKGEVTTSGLLGRIKSDHC